MAVLPTGEVVANVDRARAFAFVSEPRRVAGCIPGCGDLRELGPNRYAAVLTANVAFISVKFNVIVEVVRITPPDAIEAVISGDAAGNPSRVTATAGLDLVEQGDSAPLIRYRTEMALTGRLGGLGEPVFRSTSTRLAAEFAQNLKCAMEAVD